MTQTQPLEYFLQGNNTSKNIVVFLQGWPDNRSVWQPLDYQTTLKDNQLLFINFPNTSSTQPTLKWGQDFPEIIQRMKVTFDLVKLQNFERKVAVAHDWGCTYLYYFDNTFPNEFDEMITLDVAPYVQLPGIKPKIFVIIYQFILALAFLIGGTPGSLICKGVSKFFKYEPKHFNQLSGARCYPYFYLWKNMIQGILDKRKLFLYRYTPSAPVTFLYGKRKPFQFTSQKWENYLKDNQGCEKHEMDCGHWIMNKFGIFLADLITKKLKRIK